MIQQKTPKFGLCLDWETSGADFGLDSTINYQGLSYGAIVFSTEDFTPIEKIYREVKFNPKKWKWQTTAENVHGMSVEYLNEHGVDQKQAAADLAEIILKYWGPESKVMFLGHNPTFDIRFTDQLLNQIGIEFSIEKTTELDSWIQVHHVVLDTSAAGFITTGIYKSDLLFSKMGFTDRGKHNSLQDAEETLQTCAILREIVNQGFAGL